MIGNVDWHSRHACLSGSTLHDNWLIYATFNGSIQRPTHPRSSKILSSQPLLIFRCPCLSPEYPILVYFHPQSKALWHIYMLNTGTFKKKILLYYIIIYNKLILVEIIIFYITYFYLMISTMILIKKIK